MSESIVTKKVKDMKLYEVEKEMRKIRKECKDKGVPCTSSMRYMELMSRKKVLEKPKLEEEVKLAKIRSLWRKYCETTVDKPSKKEFLEKVKKGEVKYE